VKEVMFDIVKFVMSVYKFHREK